MSAKAARPIPLTFAVERATSHMDAEQTVQAGGTLCPAPPRRGARHHRGRRQVAGPGPAPLSLFSAERVDFSLHRLRHYSGTDPAHFQSFVLFTNYSATSTNSSSTARRRSTKGAPNASSKPGNRITERGKPPSTPPLFETAANARLSSRPAGQRRHHPGQHRRRAVECQDGHRPSRRAASARLADGRPLRRAAPPISGWAITCWRTPICATTRCWTTCCRRKFPCRPCRSAARLAQAVSEITGAKGRVLKERLRTGTVVTTSDRNWELRFAEQARRFNQSRAIAIDMESATIAANGYRFRVPYGTLLCVSDRPLHGEINCPAWRTRSTRNASASICRSAFARWSCCARRPTPARCIRASCAALPNRRLDRIASDCGVLSATVTSAELCANSAV